jgi:MFS family permease
VIARNERVRIPLRIVLARHLKPLLLGTVATIAVFVIFYLMTVFSLSWGTSQLGFQRADFLSAQMIGVLFFALTIPLAALLADRFGHWAMLTVATVGIFAFGIAFSALLHPGGLGGLVLFSVFGFSLVGLAYGPLGTALAELFPAAVRYTGASAAFSLAGILGASLAPYIATWLAGHYGLTYVGFYLSAAAMLTFMALLAIQADRPETQPRTPR